MSTRKITVKNGTVEIESKYLPMFTDKNGRLIAKFITIKATDDKNIFDLENYNELYAILDTEKTKAVVTLDEESPF
jgi:hypothetical protein